MTNIRTSGFDSPAQLREYLAEIDDGTSDDNTTLKLRSISDQIRLLRQEIADLSAHIDDFHQANDSQSVNLAAEHPWLRIAATVAFTFVLGQVAQRLRLGAPGAAAVPLVAAQLERQVW